VLSLPKLAFIPTHLSTPPLTANLHLIPQLRLRLLALLLRARLTLCWRLPLQRDLARMHVPVRLQTRAPRIIIRCVCDTRRGRRANFTRANAPREPLRLLPLQLLEHLLHRDRVENVLRGRGQDREDREGAVFLVLFESPS
jgi:hypothetical protein